MMLRNTEDTFGCIAKGFHWIMVLGFIALYVIGFYMTGLPLGPDMFEQIALHKSIGMIVLGLSVLRLVWRFTNPNPKLPSGMPTHERIGSYVSHIALYGVMIVMPLSGWAMSSAANYPVSIFGWVTMANIMDPSKEAVEFLKSFHGLMAWVILALIAVHVLAALKHHFINKDNVLTRMLPFTAFALIVMANSAQATDWTVRSEDSKLGFFATQAGAEFEGAFQKFDSQVKFDPAHPDDTQVKIIIDMASVDTQSADRDSNIVTEDWFHVAKFPTAIFETKSVREGENGGYIAVSDLTMRGVTKEVDLPFTVEIENGKAHAKGEIAVSRTDYGIGQGQWAVSTVVGDEVRIFFDLQADAQ
ncbi:MAG: YceI family protein [Methylocystaceae bacterium]|nr:YceI family protein [Methylocystaceae bacterium]